MNRALVGVLLYSTALLGACDRAAENGHLATVKGHFLREHAPATSRPIDAGLVVFLGPVKKRLEVGEDGIFATELPPGHYKVYGVADDLANGRPALCPLPGGVDVSKAAVDFELYCYSD